MVAFTPLWRVVSVDGFAGHVGGAFYRCGVVRRFCCNDETERRAALSVSEVRVGPGLCRGVVTPAKRQGTGENSGGLKSTSSKKLISSGT